RGGELDPRCDLFSLGVVLYEMAAGAMPFDGPDYFSTLYAVTNDEPRPLGCLRPELPASFTNLVHQLLAKNPDERPANAAAAVVALQAIEAGDSAAGPRAANRSSSWFRRWGVGLAALLLMTAGVLFLKPAGDQAQESGPGLPPIRVGFLHSLTGELAA